ncbi:hypothetical protein [[Clostridium] colinum]|uniref:hypothetical protein n=1 Tax=[Clostridium] colinum TaxID=36835 RepID=UPI002024539E|nr:hypothetical protein [[Clostridium] colinum]
MKKIILSIIIGSSVVLSSVNIFANTRYLPIEFEIAEKDKSIMEERIRYTNENIKRDLYINESKGENKLNIDEFIKQASKNLLKDLIKDPVDREILGIN